jgi:hypothetical protein
MNDKLFQLPVGAGSTEVCDIDAVILRVLSTANKIYIWGFWRIN